MTDEEESYRRLRDLVHITLIFFFISIMMVCDNYSKGKHRALKNTTIDECKRENCHIVLLSTSILFILLHALFAPYIAVLLVFITSAPMVFYTKRDASVAIFTMVIWYVAIVHAWNPRVDRW